jgi:hypothetical protein
MNKYWYIYNLSSIGTHCGKYDTKEQAIENAEWYGGVVLINDDSRIVYVAKIPLL